LAAAVVVDRAGVDLIAVNEELPHPRLPRRDVRDHHRQLIRGRLDEGSAVGA
jgi:hypothetical protein